MELPNRPSLNTYVAYKGHTNFSVRTLVELSGYPLGLPVGPAAKLSYQHGESGRLKGKARLQAKAKAKTTSSIPETAIGVKVMIKMAKMVARDNSAKVPKILLTSLQSAISARRAYVNIFAVQSLDSDSNRRHAHFVEVLEETLQILQDKFAVQDLDQPAATTPQTKTKKKPAAPPVATTPQTLSNFCLLDVDIISDTDDEEDLPIQTISQDTDSSTQARLDAKAQQRLIKIQEAKKGELLFGIFCLFVDVHELRTCVGLHWILYKQKRVALETVALITNLSIAAVDRAEKAFYVEFAQVLSEKPGYEEIAQSLFNRVYQQRRVDEPHVFGESGPPMPMSDIANLILYETFCNLKFAEELLRPSDLTMLRPGLFTPYNRTSDRSRKLDMQNGLQDLSLLMEVYLEFWLLDRVWCSSRKNYEDEFTRSFRRFTRDLETPISLSLVFATSVFFDINELLRQDVTRAFEEMQDAARDADATLSQFFARLSGQPPSKQWASGNLKIVERLHKDFVRGTMLEDEMKELKEGIPLILPADHPGYHFAPPFHLHKTHPLLCGSMLLILRLKMLSTGVGVARYSNSLLYGSHAYNAFRKLDMLDVEWADMEEFIKLYTPERLFVGVIPTNLEQCVKSLTLVSGVSSSNFSPSARLAKKRLAFSSRGSRDWHTPPPAIKILTEWMIESGTPENSGGRLLAQLNSLDTTPTYTGTSPSFMTQEILTIRKLFQSELNLLQFPLFKMHFICLDFFEGLKLQIEPFYSQGVPGYTEDIPYGAEDSLCEILDFAFFATENKNTRNHPLIKSRAMLEFFRKFSMKESGADVMKKLIM